MNAVAPTHRSASPRSSLAVDSRADQVPFQQHDTVVSGWDGRRARSPPPSFFQHDKLFGKRPYRPHAVSTSDTESYMISCYMTLRHMSLNWACYRTGNHCSCYNNAGLTWSRGDRSRTRRLESQCPGVTVVVSATVDHRRPASTELQ